MKHLDNSEQAVAIAISDFTNRDLIKAATGAHAKGNPYLTIFSTDFNGTFCPKR